MDESEKLAGAARRSETLNSGIAHLMVINGGAAVALLAFLQAVWDKSPDLSSSVLLPILLFAFGACAAGTVNLLRYNASWYAERRRDARDRHREERDANAKRRLEKLIKALGKTQRKWSSWSKRTQWLAVAVFALATLIVTLGITTILCRMLVFWAVSLEIMVALLGLTSIVCVLRWAFPSPKMIESKGGPVSN